MYVALLSAALCLARSKGKERSPLPADAFAQELMESEKSLKCLKILGKPYAWHYLTGTAHLGAHLIHLVTPKRLSPS